MAEKSPYHDSSYGSEDERTNSQDSRMEKETLAIKSDVEAQIRHVRGQSTATIAPEYQIPTSTKYLYLALYFGLNLTLTLYNKAVLGKVRSPWLSRPFMELRQRFVLVLTCGFCSSPSPGCSPPCTRPQRQLAATHSCYAAISRCQSSQLERIWCCSASHSCSLST